jgi:RNA polymerase sigma-70 factor (ECF subfamily)
MTSVSWDTEHSDPRPGASDEDAARLVLSVREPDRFGEIFDRYFPDIHGYVARRLGRDIADDVAAETFLTAFRARHRFDPARGTARSWLYGIATNHLSAYHRQEIRACRAAAAASASAAAAETESLADRVAARVDAGAARRELGAALAGLPRGDREVLLLVALGGLTHTEVAAALGIPYGTVGSRLNRVRRKLRSLAGAAVGNEEEA